MSGNREVTYELDFPVGSGSRRSDKSRCFPERRVETGADRGPIPRIARLMALAIRFEGLVRDNKISDYAELARLGRVSRARITQITKLLHLAPDIQEIILFLPERKGLNERSLRSVVHRIDWDEQRQIFQRCYWHRRRDESSYR